jgi:ubiquinone/menaquinone biosynthesis C-methylase UbiE
VVKPRAFDEIHEIVRTLVSPYLKGARVLDVAAGNGLLSNWMIEQGATVDAVDLNPSDWVAPIECTNANLNDPLPFKDNAFDLVVSVETIEHLDSPYLFLRELIRVLKRGGTLLVTTPNTHSLKSRIKYLFTGLPALFDFVPGYGPFGGHISPVSIGHFMWSFDENEIEFKDVYTTGPVRTSKQKVISSVISFVLWPMTKLMKKMYRDQQRHYLTRLSDQQIKNLQDDLIVIVMGEKSKI